MKKGRFMILCLLSFAGFHVMSEKHSFNHPFCCGCGGGGGEENADDIPPDQD